ncbi:neurotactin-like isoform X4 [Dreissena polymorpha]|nr:neurotactin-like isoform X1 [Dreissena polymorpha]XP_052254794.1 neurotactin-like isoform X2 [Dreissena polymorpha]XP_052254795.1 neurotactin-like isoform X3 [Dreissena polymorpha]XP_052254796.1 neurotactin-like isoform X4 [Dreissena polymorpha]
MVGISTIICFFLLKDGGECFILFDSSGNGNRNSSVSVDVSCGRITGQWSYKDQGYSFLGIPYAEPPVGRLRWKPPVALEVSKGNCWSGEIDARVPGKVCLQPDNANISQPVGDEDCLYLNVWTPSLDVNASLPVMVWIHGGSLVVGSGNDAENGYAPSARLAHDLNVVFVSMNYRLNAFGFMALELLVAGSPTGTSGNYGLMDQIEVLKWVKMNVRKFGGDPNQVTVFGQSSGGTAIFALQASALTENLFHKAWLQSASPVMNKTAAQAFKDNKPFLKNTGCSDVDCLYNLTQVDVLRSIPWDEFPYWSMDDQLSLPTAGRFDGALPIVDGYVLKEAPFEAWVHGHGRDVPTIIGSTAQEANEEQHIPENRALTPSENYEKYVRQTLGTFDDVIFETALNLYPSAVISPDYQINTMISDLRVICPTDYMTLIASSAFTSNVYRYVATFATSQPSSPFGGSFKSRYAFHGVDSFAFFGTFDKLVNPPSETEILFQNIFREEIMSFVKSGRPKSKDWKPYPASTALVSEVTNVTSGYHTAECNFWLRNGFFSYAWIN